MSQSTKVRALCGECEWVHEADSVKETAFRGVELCALHAATPDGHGLLTWAMEIIKQKAGEMPVVWKNEVREYFAKAEGRV